MPNYCLFDVGSTYTKGCIVDTDQEKILAHASDFTTSSTDISIGIEKIKSKMKSVLDHITIHETLVCSSAKGGLRMIAIGLVPDLTLKAARLACYSAGAKVIQSYSFELNQSELEHIDSSNCDILLLSGGTDGGNQSSVRTNANQLIKLKSRFPIIYAGNKSCQDEIKALLEQNGFECILCANVMPTYGVLDVDECKEKIRELFLKSIIKARGLSRLSELVDDIVLPTPSSVMEALKLLSKGTLTENGLGDLMAIDIGGATTDVYSMNQRLVINEEFGYKGLQEPLEKRSVEGDLGLRFSSMNVYELMKDRINDTELDSYLNEIKHNVHCVPNPKYDKLLASWCTEIACERHVGRLETSYTPMGVSYYQTGKDCRDVKILIGIGGPIIYAEDAYSILSNALSQPNHKEILLPNQCEFYLDKSYIISCLGLLANKYPDTVLRILKRNMERIHHV
ncbi:MAG TPA: methylaspartate mutase accessory protein GlmL [Erysipelotrichaceae bacterium]|nr:methylaspartate mutase accessory protein GlmL [Erysipelotrichaceae bacterium]